LKKFSSIIKNNKDMGRKQPKDISREEQKHMLNMLWTMIALLETREDVENFFKDLLSPTESMMVARRIMIANRLLEGEGYDTICHDMGAGPGTVASVHRWLQQGKGYKDLIPKLQKEQERQRKVSEKEKVSYERGSLEWMKRRYPLHFLLLNIVDESNLRAPKKLRKVK